MCVESEPKICPPRLSINTGIQDNPKPIRDDEFLTMYGEMTDEEFHCMMQENTPDLFVDEKYSSPYDLAPMESSRNALTYPEIGTCSDEFEKLGVALQEEGIQSAEFLIGKHHVSAETLFSIEDDSQNHTGHVIESSNDSSGELVEEAIQNLFDPEQNLLDELNLNSNFDDFPWQSIYELEDEEYYSAEEGFDEDLLAMCQSGDSKDKIQEIVRVLGCRPDLGSDHAETAVSSGSIRAIARDCPPAVPRYEAVPMILPSEEEISKFCHKDALVCDIVNSQKNDSAQFKATVHQKEASWVDIKPSKKKADKTNDKWKGIAVSPQVQVRRDISVCSEQKKECRTSEGESPLCQNVSSQGTNEMKLLRPSEAGKISLLPAQGPLSAELREVLHLSTQDSEEQSDKKSLKERPVSGGSHDLLPHRNPYTELMFSSSEDQELKSTWSILSDVPVYTRNHRPGEHKHFEPVVHPTRNTDLLEKADATYVPRMDRMMEWQERLGCELDMNYNQVRPIISNKFDPDRNITTTYLWPEQGGGLNKPLIAKIPSSWFYQGSFPINIRGETEGRLLDGTPVKVRTLIDSGATKPILSKKFYQATPYLHQYPRYKIPSRKLYMADGKIVEVNECINIMIKFSGHVFEMATYLMDICPGYDLIIGQKTMYELEGGPHFGNLSFHFMMRSLPLYADRDIVIRRGETKSYKLNIKELPEGFQEGNTHHGIIKLRSSRPDQLVQTLLAKVEGNQISVRASNDGREDWNIKKDEMMGCLDMRSFGYFHISREALQRVMGDHCKFLTEDETEEYFCKLDEDYEEMVRSVSELQTNTKLVDRNSHVNVKDTNMVPNKQKDPYPWLEEDDPRRRMTDEEIIRTFVDLTDSDLTAKEKEKLYKVMIRYKKAFSLRDEIGICPDMEVELELTDKTPFFIRPFPIKEKEKEIVDKQMRKGCLLGILKKGMSSYSSPIMLLPRKQGGIPRIVTDFRHLNSRLVTLQPSIPLVRDAIQILGASGCEVISIIDLRDAYHTIRLAKLSQQYCGITPYYGSDTYLYQRLGMGLSVSPAIWQNFIQRVLSGIPNYRKHHLAIMDDCLVHSKKKDHLDHLVDLFQALIKNGLKISPKKCQLFRKKMVYMGHTLLIEDNIPKITPLKSRVEAILKLDPPKTAKNCKQFCGMVNYLSMFLKDLQTKLIPIYQLTRKGIPFVWTEEHQKAFEEIKKDLTNPPVLAMPNDTGHLILVSDTSTTGCGAALYQEQRGRYRLVAYYSKKLPEAVKRYSISELELTGILCNVSAFKHILRNVNFTVYCDHSALVHILKAKREPPTLRLKKLIEHLSDYSFGIKFLNGKEMYISDFLSRNTENDDDSPNEIIPISFLAKEVLIPFSKEVDWYVPYGNVDTVDMILLHECNKCAIEECDDRFSDAEILCIITRSMTQAANAEVPKMYPLHGEHRKPEKAKEGIIDLTKQQERQPIQPLQKDEEPLPQEIGLPQNLGETKIRSRIEELVTEPIPRIPVTLPNLQNVGRIPSKGINKPSYAYEGILEPIPIDVRLHGQLPSYDMDKILEEDTLIPDITDKRKSKQLFKSIDGKSILRSHIPKQVELDKFIESLRRKVIHDYKIPVSVKELKAEYPNSPFYRDIYKYIMKGVNRFVGKAQRLFKIQCEDYVVMEGVLFKLRYEGKQQNSVSLVLCVPEKYIPIILHQYHDSILAGHPGVSKLYATLRQKYYFPGMYTIVRQYVISCLECQSMKEKENTVHIHYPRIPLDYRPMARFSMDVKHMPGSKMGFNKILVCTCEATNWVVAIPIVDERASTIAEALYFKVICIYGTPKAIICDEAPAFTSDLMKAYFHALNIRPYYISPMNHGSNRSERYIRTMNEILCKHLTGIGDNWPLYVQPACYAMNTQVSLVTGYSPYEMVFIQSPPDLFNFDFDPDKSGIKVGVRKYMDTMKNRFKLIKSIVKERKTIEAQTQQIKEMRKNPDYKGFAVGDLVFLYHGPGSKLQIPARKLNKNWIGPLRVQEILDDSHYLISDWRGELLPQKVHVNRIKPCSINLGEISDEGLLEVVSNTKDLFDKWKNVIDTNKGLHDI